MCNWDPRPGQCNVAIGDETYQIVQKQLKMRQESARVSIRPVVGVRLRIAVGVLNHLAEDGEVVLAVGHWAKRRDGSCARSVQQHDCDAQISGKSA